MSIELRPDLRMNWKGEIVEFAQWQVWVDGSHVAYIDHTDNAELRPHVVDFPLNRMQEIIDGCELERSRLEKPSKVVPPPEYNLRFIECHKVIQEQQRKAYEDDDE
jgi:hypothetical protein